MSRPRPDLESLERENEDLRAQVAALSAQAARAASKADADVTGRLIEAQEAERARLARELHDDFSQRLALLAVNLHLLRGALPETAAKLRESVKGLHAGVQELARDVRRMSE
ncbi:MAG: histidine kinase, partial [Acidobacteria bacterium]